MYVSMYRVELVFALHPLASPFFVVMMDLNEMSQRALHTPGIEYRRYFFIDKYFRRKSCIVSGCVVW